MASADNFFILISVFMLGIALITGIVIWNTAMDATVDVMQATATGQGAQANAQSAVDSFDFYFVLLFFASHLGVIILAFGLRSHPLVYVAVILLVAVLALVAAPLSNIYQEVTAEAPFASAAATMPMTNEIMEQLPMIEVVFGFFTGVILVGLAKVEGII